MYFLVTYGAKQINSYVHTSCDPCSALNNVIVKANLFLTIPFSIAWFLNPFDTINVCLTWCTPDTSGGSRDPPKGVLAFKCSFRQITKVLKVFLKHLLFFTHFPQIVINGGCRGQRSLADTPKFDVFQFLNGCFWWYSLGGTQCLHATRGPWGLMS